MRDRAFVSSLECEAQEYSPERTLLAAVLERAFRDLQKHIERKIRRTAISWFLCTCPGPEENLYGFTFKQIVEELGLCSARVEELVDAAKKAEQDDFNDRENTLSSSITSRCERALRLFWHDLSLVSVAV
jgi:hypothetical protein